MRRYDMAKLTTDQIHLNRIWTQRIDISTGFCIAVFIHIVGLPTGVKVFFTGVTFFKALLNATFKCKNLFTSMYYYFILFYFFLCKCHSLR
ncbi:hypothetical protein CDAR_459551 [Caerostris darwini]|uniref:Uncharacterized protein n=1 Tax=Caerostris darwini TaxID=1538125 RepID=A0AAV4USY8_9ARAC|nr:hypothetical protein CDAR_459551 [Caerostris darwini]